MLASSGRLPERTHPPEAAVSWPACSLSLRRPSRANRSCGRGLSREVLKTIKGITAANVESNLVAENNSVSLGPPNKDAAKGGGTHTAVSSTHDNYSWVNRRTKTCLGKSLRAFFFVVFFFSPSHLLYPPFFYLSVLFTGDHTWYQVVNRTKQCK